MEIEMCADANTVMSSRISFSKDFPQTDGVPFQLSASSSSSTIDFEFCSFLGQNIVLESSSADELFCNGKILPTVDMKGNLLPNKEEPRHSPPQATGKITGFNKNEKQNNSTPFWKFKRSSSLNCSYARSLCPMPSFLSRCNSTPSAKCSKDSFSHKQCNSQKLSSNYYYQKPPLKKKVPGGNPYSNGIKILNPLLNVLSPASLFGFGSIFYNGKKRSKKM